MELFFVEFRRILEVFALWGSKESFWWISWFLCPKTELFAMEFRRILKVLRLQCSQKNFWAHFHDLCVRKQSCLPWSSDAFWTLSAFKVYKKISGRIFTIFASKNEAVCREIQTDLGSFSRASLKKDMGAFYRFLRPKTELLAVQLRRILEVFALRGLWRKFLAHYHDLCVQKRSCLPRSWDAFWTFSPCKLHEESNRHIFRIFASNNEAVCCWVQAHFGSSPHSRFTKKFLVAFSQFLRPKTKVFAVEFRRILEVLCLQGLQKKLCAHIRDLCVQIWSCFLWNSDAFRKFSPCEVCKKVLGALSQRLRPKTKLLSLEFRRILEVHCLQVLQKSFWEHIHDFCVQKWSFLSCSSDAFWKFSRCEVYKKLWAHFHDLCVQKRICLPWSLPLETTGNKWSCFQWQTLLFAVWSLPRELSCRDNAIMINRIITIFASKTEAVCREVQTDYGSFLHASFMKKFWAQFHD